MRLSSTIPNDNCSFPFILGNEIFSSFTSFLMGSICISDVGIASRPVLIGAGFNPLNNDPGVEPGERVAFRMLVRMGGFAGGTTLFIVVGFVIGRGG